MEVKRKSETREIVNRERGRKKKVNKEIEMTELKEYFEGLLEGIGRSVEDEKEKRKIGRGRKRDG